MPLMPLSSPAISYDSAPPWKPLGQGTNGPVLSLETFPSTGVLLVAGYLTSAKQSSGVSIDESAFVSWDPALTQWTPVGGMLCVR
jgi:hypothetical protein